MVRRILICFITAILLASTGFGQQVTKIEQHYYLNAEIVINADSGWPSRIIVTGKVDQSVAWLGISMYPYGVIDPQTGGTHSFVELKKGTFQHEIIVDAKFLGGSFEIGLWKTKVNKVDSTEEYSYWDKMFGFHVEDMLAYKSGLLTQLKGYQ